MGKKIFALTKNYKENFYIYLLNKKVYYYIIDREQLHGEY